MDYLTPTVWYCFTLLREKPDYLGSQNLSRLSFFADGCHGAVTTRHSPQCTSAGHKSRLCGSIGLNPDSTLGDFRLQTISTSQAEFVTA